MDILGRFRKDPLQNTLLASILFIHLLFLLIILLAPSFLHKKKEQRPLIVKTLHPKPAVATPTHKMRSTPAIAKAQPAPPPAPEVKKQPAPAPNPPEVKKQSIAQPTPAKKKEPAIADKKIGTPKQSVKKNPPPQNRANISDALRKELEESIAKIESKNDKPVVSRKAATPLALQIDAVSEEEGSASGDYIDLLTHHMHRLLSLPEYGEVKIQLRLRQDGSVAKITVLKAQNEKNRLYLESSLPHLQFPRFEGAYASKKEHTFVLTFCNQM